ncbi:hypothetical protein FNV43_RR24499 [Rhamnella rubrinervis]|uniref:Uncharacterized protein n=1 Tax=Rhamnella rubrinervis TaxID=2594499 RepID=A0A8K0DLM0_9ROSA|nr:hypothetical protein FNV43_RR24499 [Rhamnella rubrinervis]
MTFKREVRLRLRSDLLQVLRFSYKLDAIENEDDEYVKCFFKEHFHVDTIHASPLYNEIDTKENIQEVGEQDNASAILFASRSWSDRLSSLRYAVDVNRSRIRNSQEDEITQNEGEENNAVDWSTINFHARVEVPTIDDYDRLYNIRDLDVEYNNDIVENDKNMRMMILFFG